MSETIVCDICNEYEGKAGSVKMHRIHCAKKHKVEVEVEPTEPRQRETESGRERIPFGSPDKKYRLALLIKT